MGPPGSTGSGTGGGLTPQEAALRGASLAFQKQQLTGGSNNNDNGRISRQTTGSSSVYRGDSSNINNGNYSGSGSGDNTATTERGRERQALFLGAPEGGKAPDSKRASFIAATLAASRSASPATAAAAGPGLGPVKSIRASPLRGPVVDERREQELATDTTSLAPATALISLFEGKNEGDVERSPGRGAARRKQQGEPKVTVEQEKEETEPTTPKRAPTPKPKPRPKANSRDETPPPPVVKRAETEIVSPKPRRPARKPHLEPAAVVTSESHEDSDTPRKRGESKAKPNVPKPRSGGRGGKNQGLAPQSSAVVENEGVKMQRNGTKATAPLTPTKPRPAPPRKSADLPERIPPEPQMQRHYSQRQSAVSTTDGQQESRLTGAPDANRPSTSDSRSSNDSFVSASSAPTRDDTDSLLTVELAPTPTPRAITPRQRPSRPVSATPTLPIRRSATGSSSTPHLPIDSLSDAIMAGSLASARHTPMSDTRTPPPPVPPTRRSKGSGPSGSQSRRTSPHRMKRTLRQPISLSDDEEARRPQNQHHRKGLNRKKHAHHEGSRSRWREEITEREKKRYEAVWASNRGRFLVAPQQQGGSGSLPVRDERYEALSECVANVVVRDIWSRSRLPEMELAEVWDLVYARRPGAASGVHAALSKQEFVVGMWLIDQRLRGRKIPTRVSQSVWDSAKGLRVLNPEGHHHGHKGR